MLIDLRELLSGALNEITKSVVIDMEVFDDGISQYPILSKEPLELKLVKLGKNKFNIKGEGSVVLSIPCDRCLEPVDTKISFSIDTDCDLDNLEGEEQDEKDYIDGYDLDPDKLVFGEILLSMPGKTLCKDDCKGLCLVCGQNLNISECECDREVLDPRMSVFKDILSNFKEV